VISNGVHKNWRNEGKNWRGNDDIAMASCSFLIYSLRAMSALTRAMSFGPFSRPTFPSPHTQPNGFSEIQRDSVTGLKKHSFTVSFQIFFQNRKLILYVKHCSFFQFVRKLFGLFISAIFSKISVRYVHVYWLWRLRKNPIPIPNAKLKLTAITVWECTN